MRKKRRDRAENVKELVRGAEDKRSEPAKYVFTERGNCLQDSRGLHVRDESGNVARTGSVPELDINKPRKCS